MSTLNMILAQVTPADTMIQQATDTLQQAMDTAAQVVTDSAAAIAAAAAPFFRNIVYHVFLPVERFFQKTLAFSRGGCYNFLARSECMRQ